MVVLKVPERQLPRDTELYKKWKPYELIGVEIGL